MFIVRISQWLFYLVLAAITILAIVPQDQAVISTGWDKANHALAFFVLLALMDNAYPSLALWQRKVLPLLAYGLLIECVQAYLPERFFSLLDVLGDAVGLCFYIMLRPLLLEKIPFINTEQFQKPSHSQVRSDSNSQSNSNS
ncbi:MAG: VanZ family protein [Pseudomonadales bacterium]